MTGKRIQVPVSPETEKAITDYAGAMGLSKAAACSQMLEQAAPGLVELTHALKKAQQSPHKALQDMAKVLNKATEKADQMALDMEPVKKQRKKRA